MFLVVVKKPVTTWGQKSMTKKIGWKQELLDSAKFNKKQEDLLKNGAKSLTESWLNGVLYTRWKKLKDIREKLITVQVFRNGKKLRMQIYASLDNWLEPLEQTPIVKAKDVSVDRFRTDYFYEYYEYVNGEQKSRVE